MHNICGRPKGVRYCVTCFYLKGGRSSWISPVVSGVHLWSLGRWHDPASGGWAVVRMDKAWTIALALLCGGDWVLSNLDLQVGLGLEGE